MEIANLLDIVERDLRDASEGSMSVDWRFGIAYNAALKLCTILLYTRGYRSARQSNHYYTINALPLIIGASHTKDAQYLDRCRIRRNKVEYDAVGLVTKADAEELISFAKDFKEMVVGWLKKHFPELLK
jgi:uncharacterized protein (UPF0332 family)